MPDSGNFRFLNWQVYKDAQELFSAVLKIVKNLPREYRFEVGSQLLRSALSISLNIAEGSGKNSPKELNRFLDIALGSAYETLACLDTLQKNQLLEEKIFNELKNHLDGICRQLGGLRKKILNSSKSSV